MRLLHVGVVLSGLAGCGGLQGSNAPPASELSQGLSAGAALRVIERLSTQALVGSTMIAIPTSLFPPVGSTPQVSEPPPSWTPPVSDPPSGTPPSPTLGEPAELQGILAAHNAVRASATPVPTPALGALEWSDELAAQAQAWADLCTMSHANGGVGESIYAQPESAVFDGATITDAWAATEADYDWASNSCTDYGCHLYTHIVARVTTKMGCAVTHCTDGKNTISNS